MKPNVLFICTDHWPASALGCHGNTNIMTPTLDILAKNGIDFSQCYSTCPVCIPARRSIMTGVFPKTHGDRVYSDQMLMPDLPTLAQTFSEAGYQTMGVGKLHVYPQRNRIGFDDVILMEEGRYEFGTVDDYQIWLGEMGYAGKEFGHTIGSNSYYTRPWHLPEEAHPTSWATTMMAKQIKRKDPTRPALFYISYQAPHPPIIPVQAFLDMYKDSEMPSPHMGTWLDDSNLIQSLQEQAVGYSVKEIQRAIRGFYAQCTHIDSQIRFLIGTLRECNLLDDTIIVFTSDHGEMLFDHGMVAKRIFYENSCHVPFILSGKPLEGKSKPAGDGLVCLEDIMPTLLSACDIAVPPSVEGYDMLGEKRHEYIYGECGEGDKATRMIRSKEFKLIYYPWGNKIQLFNIQEDPHELQDLSSDQGYADILEDLTQTLVANLYGTDSAWIAEGQLVGAEDKPYKVQPKYGLYNQRGLHWPAPTGYSNLGKNT